jgi:hypothetical protein
LAGQDKAEFIATDTGQRIRFPNNAGQAQADLLQQSVSVAVAEGIVDLFETVHIQDKSGQKRAVPFGTDSCLLQAIDEQAMSST